MEQDTGFVDTDPTAIDMTEEECALLFISLEQLAADGMLEEDAGQQYRVQPIPPAVLEEHRIPYEVSVWSQVTRRSEWGGSSPRVGLLATRLTTHATQLQPDAAPVELSGREEKWIVLTRGNEADPLDIAIEEDATVYVKAPAPADQDAAPSALGAFDTDLLTLGELTAIQGACEEATLQRL